MDYKNNPCNANREMILAVFDLQVAPILPTKFRVNWPFGSGEKKFKNIFKMAASLIILSNSFSIDKLPRYFLPSYESTVLSVREKFQIHFQDGGGRGHL